MTVPHRVTAAIVTTVIALVLSILAPPTASAQDVILSPVPKEPCCFNNFRFGGTCQVKPRQGQYCENILSYLNNFNSMGESYCMTTNIRGGWTQVDCASGASSGEIAYTTPQTIDRPRTPDKTNVVVPSEANIVTPQENVPRAIDSKQMEMSQASVIQVRLEQPLDGGKLDAGQQLTGRLEADLIGPNGEVLAPAGSTISAEVGAEQAWGEESTGGLQLKLVGTTSSAADLFGTAEGEAQVEKADLPSVHLTGDLVELSSDSVLTFQVEDISEQPADMRVLTTATSVWMAAFNDRDATTLAGLSSPDGALLPPNGRAIIGRDAIYAYWTGLLNDSTTRVELVNVETVVEGDLGYKAGRFEHLNAATGETVDQGKYMQIWKRSAGGYWELHRDMWNSSMPTAAPSGS
jgi:ketosteroid isomerase-like protein